MANLRNAGASAVPEASDLRKAAPRIVRHTLVLAAAQVANRAAGFVSTLLLARLMPIGDFGRLTLLLAVLVLTQILQDLGTTRLVIRDVAHAPSDWRQVAEPLISIKLVLGVLGGLLLLCVTALSGDGGLFGPSLLVTVALPAFNVWLLLENVAQGLGATAALVLGYSSLAWLQSVLGVAAAYLTGGSLYAVVASFAVAALACTVLLAAYARRAWGRFGPRWDWPRSRQMLWTSLPYLGVALIGAAPGRMEVLLLGHASGTPEVAVFAVGFKFYEAAMFGVLTFQIAVNPVAARLLDGNRDELCKLFAWQITAAFAGMAALAFVGAMIAPMLIGVIFPAAFLPAVRPTVILFAALPFAAVGALGSGLFALTERRRTTLGATGAIFAVELLLGVLLVPPLGAVGATLAIAGSQVVGAVLFLLLVRRLLVPSGGALFAGLRRVAVAVSGAAGLGWLVLVPLGPVAGAAAVLACYAAGLLVLRVRLVPA